MKKNVFSFLFLMAVSFSSIAQNTQQAQEALQKVNRQFFIENKGQWPDEVLFLTRIGGLDAWITKNGITYDFYQLEEINTRKDKPEHSPEKDIPDYIRIGHVVKTELIHTNPTPISEGKDKQKAYYNYFIGNDSTKWASFVKLYNEAWVKQIYPDIDMRYYFDKQQLRYDYVVQPGADPKNIQFTFVGANDFYITDTGDLAFTTRFGEVKQTGLFVYQWINGRKIPVESSFTIMDKQHISFRVGTYNTQYPLIIDPLIYSTFLGGNIIEYGGGVAVDASGNAYITGWTSSINFPVTAGAYQTTYGGGYNDAFVSKLNPTGSALVYSTFLGGNGVENGYNIEIDVSGNAYIMGGTRSTNYPVTAGAYQTTFSGVTDDVFVTKLNAAGSALVYSTFLGGNINVYGGGIAIDTSGNAYITGWTNSINYPVTAGAYQTTFSGGTYDVFVTKLNANGSALVYSTFLGGSGSDEGYDIVIDASGNAYIAGEAASTNYPVTSGVYQTSHGGGNDAFVTKLNAAGSALVYSTFLGGSSGDGAYSIAIDASGNAYVTGTTLSANYPVTAGAYQTLYGGGKDAFVTKLNAAGSALVYSTFLGGSSGDGASSIAIDASGNAYITGGTSSINYPVTAGVYQTTYGGGSYSDAFVTQLNPTGSALVYSTFLGGSGADEGYGIVIDVSGNVYVTGYTYSTDYPVKAGAYQTTYGGGSYSDAFVTKLDLCLPTYDTLTVTTCNSYTSPSGNYTWNTSGTYNDTLVNAAGCDSIVTVNLTININTVINAITTTICQGDSILLGGYYQTAAGTYYDTISNGAANGCDSVIVTTLMVNTITNNTTAAICQGDSILLGGTYQTAAGTYYDTISNGAVNGCDSVIVTTLTINSVDTSVTNNSPTLTANASGATYQWLDCNNGFAPIAGETGQSFTAIVNGDYAVAVTQNACTDTSACFAVTNIGIVENDFGSLLKLYPNPTKGEFIVDLGENYQYVLVTVTDVIGRTIMHNTYAHSQLINLELNEAEGIYFLKIDADGKKAVIRIVKE